MFVVKVHRHEIAQQIRVVPDISQRRTFPSTLVRIVWALCLREPNGCCPASLAMVVGLIGWCVNAPAYQGLLTTSSPTTLAYQDSAMACSQGKLGTDEGPEPQDAFKVHPRIEGSPG